MKPKRIENGKYAIEHKEKRIEFSACIFDFDGVVMDTEKLHFQAWNKGFSTLLDVLTWEEYLPLKSTGRKHIVETFGTKLGRELTNEEYEKVCKIKDEEFQKLCKNADRELLINGVEEFLKELSTLGVKLAVASSASTTTSLLEKVGLKKYFHVVADGNLGLPKKPNPAVFLHASSLLEVEPENCLVFEDSKAGIQAAFNCGMDVVAIGGIKDENAFLELEDFSNI